MYIPIEIGQEVYAYVEGESIGRFRAGIVDGVSVSKDGIFVRIDFVDMQKGDTSYKTFPLDMVYPSKKVAIEELKRFATERMEKSLEKFKD